MIHATLRRIFAGAVHQKVGGNDSVDIFVLTDSRDFAVESLRRIEAEAKAIGMKMISSDEMSVRYEDDKGNTMEAFLLERLLLGKEKIDAGITENRSD